MTKGREEKRRPQRLSLSLGGEVKSNVRIDVGKQRTPWGNPTKIRESVKRQNLENGMEFRQSEN